MLKSPVFIGVWLQIPIPQTAKDHLPRERSGGENPQEWRGFNTLSVFESFVTRTRYRNEQRNVSMCKCTNSTPEVDSDSSALAWLSRLLALH